MTKSPRRLFFIAAALLTVLAAGCASGSKKTGSAEVLLNERMAAVLLREGRAAEAEKAYREALPNDSKNPEVHDGLGVALLMQGRFKDAEADFRAGESSPSPEDRLDAAINRGRLKQRQKDFTAAEDAFSEALSRNPKSSSALIGRGIAREARGALEPAAEDYLGAIRLEPRNAEAHLRLGLVLVTLKKTALGRRYLERTIELDPAGELGAKARLLLDSDSAAPKREGS